MAAGFWLLKTWSDTSHLPAGRVPARIIAVIGVVLFAAGFAEVAGHYAQYRMLGLLIPEDQLPKTGPEIEAHAADLLVRYPQDPRSRMYRAITMVDTRDFQGAEKELRTAIRQADDHTPPFTRQFDNSLRVLLAKVLFKRGEKPRHGRPPVLSVVRLPPSNRMPRC